MFVTTTFFTRLVIVLARWRWCRSVEVTNVAVYDTFITFSPKDEYETGRTRLVGLPRWSNPRGRSPTSSMPPFPARPGARAAASRGRNRPVHQRNHPRPRNLAAALDDQVLLGDEAPRRLERR